MLRSIKIILILTGIFYFCFFSQPAFAKNRVLTDVKVIHASTKTQYVDPSLKKIVSELKSVFKYTSYRLLKDQNLTLHFNQEGHVNLPRNMTLIVIPSGMERKRIRYQINIQKNNRSIFQTRVLLKNNASITIGGPQFDNGVLLFNIFGSMQ